MGRPPRRLLDRETIIRAGLDLVDEHGAEALSVNRVAAALGVKGPSLYKYIAGRDDLIEGVRDLIVAEMRLDHDISPWTATLEAWARSADNPVGGWYGLRKGFRGRFGNYLPPLLERLGLAEVEHNPRNNRMRAI